MGVERRDLFTCFGRPRVRARCRLMPDMRTFISTMAMAIPDQLEAGTGMWRARPPWRTGDRTVDPVLSCGPATTPRGADRQRAGSLSRRSAE